MCYYHSPSLVLLYFTFFFFFFQAEDGIRDSSVTGVQTCALPIFEHRVRRLLDALAQAVEPRPGGELPRVKPLRPFDLTLGIGQAAEQNFGKRVRRIGGNQQHRPLLLGARHRRCRSTGALSHPPLPDEEDEARGMKRWCRNRRHRGSANQRGRPLCRRKLQRLGLATGEPLRRERLDPFAAPWRWLPPRHKINPHLPVHLLNPYHL